MANISQVFPFIFTPSAEVSVKDEAEGRRPQTGSCVLPFKMVLVFPHMLQPAVEVWFHLLREVSEQ